jgi:hypothetical protein
MMDGACWGQRLHIILVEPSRTAGRLVCDRIERGGHEIGAFRHGDKPPLHGKRAAGDLSHQIGRASWLFGAMKADQRGPVALRQ